MQPSPSLTARSSSVGAEEKGMKDRREHVADIFAKHGEIAAKMKSAPGPGTTVRREDRECVAVGDTDDAAGE